VIERAEVAVGAIVRRSGKPAALRFMLGDRSEVGLR